MWSLGEGQQVVRVPFRDFKGAHVLEDISSWSNLLRVFHVSTKVSSSSSSGATALTDGP